MSKLKHLNKILIADKNKDIYKLVDQNMKTDEIKLYSAKNQIEIVNLMQTMKLRILILDYELVKENFSEFLNIIKSIDKFAYVIIICEDNNVNTIKTIRKQKIFYLMIKPIQLEEIHMVLENIHLNLNKKNIQILEENN